MHMSIVSLTISLYLQVDKTLPFYARRLFSTEQPPRKGEQVTATPGGYHLMSHFGNRVEGWLLSCRLGQVLSEREGKKAWRERYNTYVSQFVSTVPLM